MLEKLMHLDIVGLFLIHGALICYLLALQWGGVSKSWASSEVIGRLVGFAALFILFCGNEAWLGDKAMVPLRIIKKRTVATTSAYIFL